MFYYVLDAIVSVFVGGYLGYKYGRSVESKAQEYINKLK